MKKSHATSAFSNVIKVLFFATATTVLVRSFIADPTLLLGQRQRSEERATTYPTSEGEHLRKLASPQSQREFSSPAADQELNQGTVHRTNVAGEVAPLPPQTEQPEDFIERLIEKLKNVEKALFHIFLLIVFVCTLYRFLVMETRGRH